MSEFATEGRKEMPSLYGESQMVHDVGEWTEDRLRERAVYYNALSNTDLMPRAREQVGKILSYILFEIAYRKGVYDE